ncbi:MAG: DUF2263 domain-containing protein [Legionellales bacterium]|nr:DUF2263 domain-containing protein [Legionellales bacterium]
MPLKGFAQQLMRAYARNGNKSTWLTMFNPQNDWRYQSVKQTLTTILDPQKHQDLVKQAQTNLLNWQKNSTTVPPSHVSVSSQDWGTTCLDATRQYGKPYVVLNNANASFPGGAFLYDYGAAQEENIWHRSDSALSLAEEHVLFDQETECFSYDEHLSQIIAAQALMTPEEQSRLAQHTGILNPSARSIYLSNEPRVCFRGPECLLDQNNPDEISGKNTIHAVPEFSFLFLEKEEIFPFYELRSAAPDKSSEIHNWHNKEPAYLKAYRETLRHCIAAQLDTLISQGKKHIILGAWGCGDFHNDPQIVADIYRDEIYKRAEHFQHIVFSILNTASHHRINYAAFKSAVEGIKLGSKTTSVTVPSEIEENKTPKMR